MNKKIYKPKNKVIDVMNYLNIDVFENIIKFLDYKSIKNVCLVNKILYNYYNHNRNCDLIVINKIENLFSVKNGKYKYNKHIINNIKKIYNKIYNQFRTHNNTYLVDMIIYLIETKYENSIYILESLLSECILRMEPNYLDKRVITFNDMTYIIVYSNNEELKIILSLFTIPLSIFYYSVQQILYKNYYEKKGYKTRLYQIIDYIYYKYCFRKMDYMSDMYIHNILTQFIRYNESTLTRYFLVKKEYYKNSLMYQTLIQECIRYESLDNLKLFINEMNNEPEKTYIIIDKNVIEVISRRGSFHIIKYVIENLMGDFINLSGYIKSICIGIDHYDGHKFDMYFKKLEMIKECLNNNSKEMINMSLSKNLRNINRLVLK